MAFAEGADDALVYEVLAEDLFEADFKDAAEIRKGFLAASQRAQVLKKI